MENEQVKKILEPLCAGGGCITCGLDDYQCSRLYGAIKQICQLIPKSPDGYEPKHIELNMEDVNKLWESGEGMMKNPIKKPTPDEGRLLSDTWTWLRGEDGEKVHVDAAPILRLQRDLTASILKGEYDKLAAEAHLKCQARVEWIIGWLDSHFICPIRGLDNVLKYQYHIPKEDVQALKEKEAK